MRFLLDEHLAKAVAIALRSHGIDALTIAEAGRRGLDDRDQLSWALEHDRVVVTRDDDFLGLHVEGVEHAGIAFDPRLVSAGRLIRELMIMDQVMTVQEMRNRVEFI